MTRRVARRPASFPRLRAMARSLARLPDSALTLDYCLAESIDLTASACRSLPKQQLEWFHVLVQAETEAEGGPP